MTPKSRPSVRVRDLNDEGMHLFVISLLLFVIVG